MDDDAIRERTRLFLKYYAGVDLADLSEPPMQFDGQSHEEIEEQVKDWFLSNFEDPVHSSPYISAEGGYQYVYGGPYDAREIVGGLYGGLLDDDIIDSIVGELEAETTDWTSSSSRHLPPADDYYLDNEKDEETRPNDPLTIPYQGQQSTDPNYLRSQALSAAKRLEEVLKVIPTSPAGMGHNNPPEALDGLPWSQVDTIELTVTIKTVRATAAVPLNPGPLKQAEVVAKSKTKKVFEYLGSLGHTVLEAAAKAFGTTVGKTLAIGLLGTPLVYALYFYLIQFLQTISLWLNALVL